MGVRGFGWGFKVWVRGLGVWGLGDPRVNRSGGWTSRWTKPFLDESVVDESVFG